MSKCCAFMGLLSMKCRECKDCHKGQTSKTFIPYSGWNKISGFWKAEYSNMWTAMCRSSELQKASQECSAEGKMRGAPGKKASGL